VFSALAVLANISPANAPAMAFNEVRLAMFSGGFALNAGLALGLRFWLSVGGFNILRGRCGGRRCFRYRVRYREIGHGGWIWRGRHGIIRRWYDIDLSPRHGPVHGWRRGGGLRARRESVDESLQTVGEAIGIEIQRIVMSVADVGIKRRVESRNKPTLSAHAGDDVKKCQPVILRGGKAWIWALRVVV